MQDEKVRFKTHEKEYKLEIERLRQDNERQQKILSANLETSPKSPGESFMEQEITRLTVDNLDLLNKNHNCTETAKTSKKQVKYLTRKLKELGFDPNENDSLIANDAVVDNIKRGRALPELKKKARDYLGMFVFKRGDEVNIMRQLIAGRTNESTPPFPFLLFIRVHVFYYRIETKNGDDSVAGLTCLHCVHVCAAHGLHKRRRKS